MTEHQNSEVRVIHINTESGWRGGERQVFNLARQLQMQGIPQVLAAKKNSELAKRARSFGIAVEEFAFRGEWDIFSAQSLARLAKSFGANILHAHTAKAHSIGLWARKRIPKENIFFVVSRRVDFPIRGNFLSKKKYFDPLVDAYIAISENVRRRLIADGITKEKIFLAYSGIDLSLWDKKSDPVALRSELRLHPDMLLLGNVAALEEHKDHATLLSAVSLLGNSDFSSAFLVEKNGKNTKLPSWRLLILGDGSLKKTLLKQAQSLGILYPHGPVQFLGYQENVYDYYRLFDAFVLSSKEEGLGTAVLDAMAAGLPVVATRAGGIPEMVEYGQGGLLSPPQDPKSLAKNLYRILIDEGFRKTAASYNKKRVRDFSHEATCKANLAVYEELLRR